MAAYRVRSVMLSGMDAPYFSGFGVVHNAARVLSPTGFGAQAFGNDASIINTRRTFDRIGGFDALNVVAYDFLRRKNHHYRRWLVCHWYNNTTT